MDEETKCWVAFSVFPGIGPVRFRLLLDYFGSAKAAWNARSQELRSIHLGDTLTEKFGSFRKSFDCDTYLSQLAKMHVSVLTLSDSRYPALLRQITDAPFVLYIRGKKSNTPWNINRAIAVVGTRKATNYGVDVTQRLVRELVSYGFTIVSGLAYGIDAVAHQTAIDAGGKTIAVLGCGIDIIAPPSNARLYRAIAQEGHGAVVAEMPLGLRPNKGLFPARNRIISGLSLGVLVTEGTDDSGALITAGYAGTQGREVFAVPGPITSPYSRGPAKLLKNGAKLVESANDIIEELGIKTSLQADKSVHTQIKAENKEEQEIVSALSDRHMHMNEIVRATSLTISEVAATLTVLEMKGIVRDYGEKEYGLI